MQGTKDASPLGIQLDGPHHTSDPTTLSRLLSVMTLNGVGKDSPLVILAVTDRYTVGDVEASTDSATEVVMLISDRRLPFGPPYTPDHSR